MAHSRLRPLRQKLEVLLLRSLGLLARALPFEATSALGAGIGLLAFHLLGRRRRIAIENITRALGPELNGMPARELARRSFIQIGRSYMEFLALPKLGPRGILDRVDDKQHAIRACHFNFRAPDEDFDLNIVANESRAASLKTVLSNSFGFGGTNASIVMRKNAV